MKDKRKLAASLTAGGMAAALLLTGTFAWQSISQKAKNEIMAETNPGGRLHDDFNGKNKDIYVENFTDEVEGAPIFARVRLREYMEVGVGAGNLKDPDRDVQVIGNQTAQFDNSSTWAIHQFGANAASTDHLVFHDYITWDEDGGSTVYMPTFNKNKDSLLSDINGTLEGPDGLRPGVQGDKYDKYQDYKSYNVGDAVQGNAIYDADDDDDDEVGDDLIPDTVDGGVTVDGSSAVNGDDYTLRLETHQAQETQNCTVITYAQWKAKPDEEKVGNYWVYDTDGWAYWAAPIMPNTATGLLLDGVSVKKTPGLEWYYAIDVEAQFATANDWGTVDGGEDKKGDGFYASANGGMQASGEEILGMAAESLNNNITISLNNTVENIRTVDSLVAQPGDRERFAAVVTINGIQQKMLAKDVKWTVSGEGIGATEIGPYVYVDGLNTNQIKYPHDYSALLTIDERVTPGTNLIVTAEYQGMTDRVEVQVKELGYEDLGDVVPGSLTTVTIDDIEWYVLVQNGGKALIWSEDIIDKSIAITSTNPNYFVWKGSSTQTYLNGEFLQSLPILKTDGVVSPTPIKSWDGQGSTEDHWIDTVDQVFLLTNADLEGVRRIFNTGLKYPWLGVSEAPLLDYTYQVNGEGVVIAPDVEMRKYKTWTNLVDGSSLLRNSGGAKILDSSRSVTLVRGFNGSSIVYRSSEGYGKTFRPAMWVNMGVEVAP